MKKQGKLITLLLYFIPTANYITAQVNLVPNPSFEQYTNCPQGYLHDHPDFWYQPDKGGGGYSMAVEQTVEMYLVHFLVFNMPTLDLRW